jgi:hypothetical protein
VGGRRDGLNRFFCALEDGLDRTLWPTPGLDKSARPECFAYDADVTSANAYELPPHSPAPAEAVDAAEHGEVVYLVRSGLQVAAIVPPDVAAAGAAAVDALEDAEDLRVALTVRAEGSPTIPMAEVLAEYADDLAAYPDDDAR